MWTCCVQLQRRNLANYYTYCTLKWGAGVKAGQLRSEHKDTHCKLADLVLLGTITTLNHDKVINITHPIITKRIIMKIFNTTLVYWNYLQFHSYSQEFLNMIQWMFMMVNNFEGTVLLYMLKSCVYEFNWIVMAVVKFGSYTTLRSRFLAMQ
jgi:hypothetical protein